jgi:hypothetical protein
MVTTTDIRIAGVLDLNKLLFSELFLPDPV